MYIYNVFIIFIHGGMSTEFNENPLNPLFFYQFKQQLKQKSVMHEYSCITDLVGITRVPVDEIRRYL